MGIRRDICGLNGFYGGMAEYRLIRRKILGLNGISGDLNGFRWIWTDFGSFEEKYVCIFLFDIG